MGVDQVLQGLVEELSDVESVDPRSLKAYAHVVDHWSMGAGAPTGFIHLTVCVLEGRSSDLLSHMADRLFLRLQGLCGRVASPAAVTLEVRQMAPSTYRKGALPGQGTAS